MLGGGETPLGTAAWLAARLGRRARARSASPTGSASARCAPTSRPTAIAEAGFEAMAEVVERLGIGADH